MGSIKVYYSAVKEYAGKCGDNYTVLVQVANNVLERVEKLYIEVQQDYEKISRQVAVMQMMNNEIDGKVKSYGNQMAIASEEINSCNAHISYLMNHPKKSTVTDSEGREIVHYEIDYEAIKTAERRRDAAQQVYDHYRKKYDEAWAVYLEVNATLRKYEMIKKAINAVSESMQSDIFEIKKYIRAIADEAEYNIHSLQGVINSLNTYLACKAIYMPIGANYEEFVS